MTMLAHKTGLKLIIACQKAYLKLEKENLNHCKCTSADDWDLTQAKNNLRGIVETYFSKAKNQHKVEYALSEFFEQIAIPGHIPYNDLFQTDMTILKGLKVTVSPRDNHVIYTVR